MYYIFSTKLTKGYRRNEPSVETLNVKPSEKLSATMVNNKPIKDKTDIIEEKVSGITNSVDELSDWLYKEFFKAIENQIENTTDNNIKIINGHRRSGRSHKRKKQKRSKKYKRKGKIGESTENDSIFDSNSENSSSDSDSDIDSESSSWEEKNSDKGHGHRKIVMIHKKPKPALPSFLFVPPSSGTDYYPPAHLPGLMSSPVLPFPPILAPFPPSGKI